jgi:chromosome segregation protein
MRLKSLEIMGFKSFFDKIVIGFPPGVTAIVGPNGCGKSNIVDAIRWVIGEQRIKSLRGRRFEDLIFNGHKSLGMAEVSLTLSNESGAILPQYSSLTEIMITRKLYRNGENEYYINKIPSRHIDIMELFGISRRSYFVVEQGGVEIILNMNPIEKRIFIEDISQISRYKKRKVAALRKIDSTRENLIRVKDIAGEIKRQLNSLETQAKVGEEYKAIMNDIKNLEIRIASEEMKDLIDKCNKSKRLLANLMDREIELDKLRIKSSKYIEEIKLNIESYERKMDLLNKEITEVNSLINAVDKEIEKKDMEIKNLYIRNKEYSEELIEVDTEINNIYSKLDKVDNIKGDLLSKINKVKKNLDIKGNELKEIKKSYEVMEKMLEERRISTIDILTRISGEKSSIKNIKKRRDKIFEKVKISKKEIDNISFRLREIGKEIFKVNENLKNKENNVKVTKKEIEENESIVKSLKELLDDKKRRMEELRDNYNIYKSRLNSLIEIYEDKKDGVFPSYKLLEDIFEVSDGYEIPLEAILEERLKYIIVKDAKEAVRVIENVDNLGENRVTAIPIKLRGISSCMNWYYEGEPLLKYINVSEEYRDIAEYLLGDVIIVKDIKKGIEIWNREDFEGRIVTLGGDILYPSGIMSGGINHGIFQKKKEIKDLKELIRNIENETAITKEEEENIISELSAIEYKLKDLNAVLNKEEEEINALDKSIFKLNEEKKNYLNKKDILSIEIDEMESEVKDMDKELIELNSRIEEMGERKLRLEKEIEGVKEEINNKKIILDKLNRDLLSLNGDIRSLTERYNNIDINKEELISRKDLLSHKSLEIKGNIGKNDKKIKELNELLINKKRELKSLIESESSLKKLLSKEREEWNRLSTSLKDEEKVKIRIDEEMRRLKDRISEENMKISQYSIKLKNIKDNIIEKYGIDDIMDIEEEITKEDRGRLNELKEKIKSFGDINLKAIDDYRELKDRYEFLMKQKEDLDESLTSLRRIIQKINRTTKDLFLNTFSEVNNRFKELFSRFFEGGKGSLILTDESNIPESGIDMVIELPGKRVKYINQLSGGERSLTAIAFIFSLFLVRPSPFFILDEVDSHLDDVNIERFKEVVKEMKDKFQFIVVTHNKKTMEIADTLYGVTMEGAGLSKLVSVKLTC